MILMPVHRLQVASAAVAEARQWTHWSGLAFSKRLQWVRKPLQALSRVLLSPKLCAALHCMRMQRTRALRSLQATMMAG